MFCLIPLVLSLADVGSALFRRPFYLYSGNLGKGSFLAGIGNQLGLPAVLALGFLIVQERGPRRFLVAVSAATYPLLFFGLGTRRFALFPLLFAVGILAAKRTKQTRIALAGSAVLTLYLIRMPIYLRTQSEHGLIPYIGALGGFFGSTIGLQSVAANILVSFPIIGVSAYAHSNLPSRDLFISLNPLFGKAAGWYSIAPFHRLNVNTPMAAIGELGNYGLKTAATYFFIVGIVLACLDRRIGSLLVEGRQLRAPLLLGLVFLFILFSVQYNLRTATRILYYAVALEVGVTVALKFLAGPYRSQSPH